MVVVVRLLSDLRRAAEAQRPYQDRSSSSPHSLSVSPLEQTPGRPSQHAKHPSPQSRSESVARPTQAHSRRICSVAWSMGFTITMDTIL